MSNAWINKRSCLRKERRNRREVIWRKKEERDIINKDKGKLDLNEKMFSVFTKLLFLKNKQSEQEVRRVTKNERIK